MSISSPPFSEKEINDLFLKHYQKFSTSCYYRRQRFCLTQTLFDRFYGEADRFYHGKSHIVQLSICNDIFSKTLYMHPRDRFLAEIAIWWHDLIYDPKRTDNEAISAEMFVAYTCNVSPSLKTDLDQDLVTEVYKTILATTHTKEAAKDLSKASLYMLDLDLIGLASFEDIFDRNSLNIRQEYQHVPIKDWITGRLKFFKSLLERGYIYHNPYKIRVFDGYQQQALNNIQREGKHLGSLLQTLSDSNQV
jgi:predicted metal-dependent HD superfamily phosphohydrolase